MDNNFIPKLTPEQEAGIKKKLEEQKQMCDEILKAWEEKRLEKLKPKPRKTK